MTANTHHSERVVVIGGGLAGLAAAIRLAEADQPVTLIEARKRLGGRAGSFEDPTTAQHLDSCQHVMLRCCTHLHDLYERLDVDDRIDWHDTIYMADRHGAVDRLRGDDLPGPFHLLRPLLGLKLFTRQEKWALMRGMMAVLQVRPEARVNLGDQTFADWLARIGQPASLNAKFWGPILVSACNERLEKLNAAYALHVLQEAFLYDNHGYHIGVPNVPLAELYSGAREHLEAAGGEIITGHGAEHFVCENNRIRLLVAAEGQEFASDAFISAVPHYALAKLISPDMAQIDPRLSRLDELEVSPIIGIHLFLAREDGEPVCDWPYLMLMDSQLQWVFNKGWARIDGKWCQHLHAVISAAYDQVDQPAERLEDAALAELRQVLPDAAEARLAHARTIKEKRATFAARPGVDAIRPATTGRIDNLYLAGDWVQTGWPATMEGAVRSGYHAADAVLARRGQEPTEPVQTAEPNVFYRLLAG